MCSCIWLAPPRLAFFLAICGVGHPLSIIIWSNKVVVAGMHRQGQDEGLRFYTTNTKALPVRELPCNGLKLEPK